MVYWHCSTHGLNALRNSLYGSQQKIARNLKLNGYGFGWKEVDTIYMRDLEYYKKNSMRITYLTEEIMYLDGYTLKNPVYAQIIFSEVRICAYISYLIHTLKIKVKI